MGGVLAVGFCVPFPTADLKKYHSALSRSAFVKVPPVVFKRERENQLLCYLITSSSDGNKYSVLSSSLDAVWVLTADYLMLGTPISTHSLHKQQS